AAPPRRRGRPPTGQPPAPAASGGGPRTARARWRARGPIPASPAGSKSKSAAGSKSSLPIVLRATTMSSWSKTQRDRPQEVRHPLTVAGGAPPNACYAELPRARDQPQEVRHPLTVAGGASPNACYAELPQAVVPLVVATGSEDLESDEDDRSESDVSYDGGRSIDGSPRPRQKAHVASTRPGALAQEPGEVRMSAGEWRDKSRFLPTLIGGADLAPPSRGTSAWRYRRATASRLGSCCSPGCRRTRRGGQ
ncbi:unnamed protein product, partial [Prorocentrum cordatum]